MNMLTKRKNIYKLIAVVALAVVVCAPVAAQGSDSGGITITVPISLSYQANFDNLPEDDDLVRDIFERADIDAGIGVLFPIGRFLSIGPEAGFSLPIEPLTRNVFIIHVPVRLVLNFALSNNISLDALLGTEFNIRSFNIGADSIDFTDLTFDIGTRLDLFGFLVGIQYTLPFSVDITAPELGSIPSDFWQNGLTISLGYKVKIGI